MTKNKDTIKVHGFFRLQISEPNVKSMEKIAGDSGWVKNLVVNLGFQDYLCKGFRKFRFFRYRIGESFQCRTF